MTTLHHQVFRSVPGLSSEVSAASPPLDQWRKFIYCAGMAEGQLLGQVDHFPGTIVRQQTGRHKTDCAVNIIAARCQQLLPQSFDCAGVK